VNDLASVILTFFAGLSVEQNLKPSRAATGRKVDNLMRVLRPLWWQTVPHTHDILQPTIFLEVKILPCASVPCPEMFRHRGVPARHRSVQDRSSP